MQELEKEDVFAMSIDYIESLKNVQTYLYCCGANIFVLVRIVNEWYTKFHFIYSKTFRKEVNKLSAVFLRSYLFSFSVCKQNNTSDFITADSI